MLSDDFVAKNNMYLKYLEQTNALHVFVVVVVYALLGVFVVVCFAWCVVYAGQGEEQSLSSRVEPQSLTAPRVDLQNTPQRLYPYRPS